MTCHTTQTFGQNANTSYKDRGIHGHTGKDVDCGHGAPVVTPYSFKCYKVLDRNNPSNDGTGFTAVFGIVDNGIECFEFLAGHLDPIALVGNHYKKGDIIGTQSNHGKVYSGGVEITPAMQQAGDTRGSHIHFQKRTLKKKRDYNGAYFLTAVGAMTPGGYYRDNQGYYYEIYNFSNGYNGCVDMDIPTFSRNLYIGRSGYDVYCLQRLLVRDGNGDFEPTGFFGVKTHSAVKIMQKKHGIPATGLVGKITLPYLNGINVL